jgi:hypothetical protein
LKVTINIMLRPKDNHFIKILKQTWGKFKIKHISYATNYYDSIVEKTINCRDPQFGYVEYQCMYCGQGIHRVGFSCKTKFCIHCSRKSSNDFIDEIMCKLHPGIVYRHLILTIPEQLRTLFYKNRNEPELYNRFMNLGRDYIEDVFRYVTRVKNLKIGCLVVLHTAGREGTYNPHLHIIVMNGGIDEDTGKWVDLPYFKYEKIMPRKWQYHLLRMIESFDNSVENIKLVKKLWKKYKKGFVNNFKKGNVPAKINHLVNYLAKYISKPSISISSIIKCDYEKEEVTYRFKDHRTKKLISTTCDFITFIGRLAQQILPKGFHRIKYFGLQHPSGYKKRVKEINEGLKMVGKRNYNDDSFIASYAIGNWKWARDPRKCSYCGSDLELSKIWSKKYGVIFDIFIDLNNSIPPPDDSILLDEKESIVWKESLGFTGVQLIFEY